MNNRDHFSDVLDAGDGGGILDSAGLRDYEGISTALVTEGAGVTMNCRRCNKKRKIVISWPELAVLSQNRPDMPPLLPEGWKFSEKNRTAYVAMRCPSCGNDTGFAIHMTPQEAQEHVKAGLASGLVSPQLVQGVQQRVAAARQQGR